MKRNDVAILDFGSGKIVCAVGSRSDDAFLVKAWGECSYGGFYEGVWLEPEKLSEAVSAAVGQAEKQYGRGINSLFIGVPGEFTSVSTAESSLKFKTKKKIGRDDVEAIFQRAGIRKHIPDLKPISQSVIEYFLDDEKTVADPTKFSASKLGGIISYIFVTDYFTEAVSKAVEKTGVNQIEFVSGCLGEALFLLSNEQRDKRAILIDVGYITTSVMLVGGDGLLFMKSFSLGGGHISADLSKVLEISYKEAERLKRKINLNLEFQPTDNYILRSGAEIKATKANEIAQARIEDIADYIIRCFDSYDGQIPLSTPLFLTGGGLSYLKGAVDYLSKTLNKKITVAKTLDPLKDKPEYASVYGLVRIAVKQKEAGRFFAD